MKFDNFNYYKKNRNFAKHLRNNSTLSEILLWKYLLKARGLKGYQFLKQRLIGIYIVDFFCKDLRLIIELDGESHQFNKTKDINRQKYLEELGYTVIRFDDSEIFDDFPIVKKILEDWIENFEKRTRG